MNCVRRAFFIASTSRLMDSDEASGVKEVKVHLNTKSDELAILGGTRRRTRGGKRKGAPEDATETAATGKTTTAPALAPSAPSATTATTTMHVLKTSTNPSTISTAIRNKVTLFGKKTSALKPTALLPPVKSHKLLAKRSTLKKPRLIVSRPTPSANFAPPSSGGPSGATSGEGVLPEKKLSEKTHPFHRRRFTERKISLSIGGGAATTQKHKAKRTRVDQMPIAHVKSLLLRKGVLKPKASGNYPPEPMLRSLLKDYLALQD